ELDRKLVFHIEEQAVGAQLSVNVLAVNIAAICIYLFFSRKKIEKNDELLGVMLGSSLLMFLLLSTPIMANRVGVLGYFFSIPFLLIALWKCRLPSNFKHMFYPYPKN